MRRNGTTRTALRSIGLMLILALVLVACGGEDDAVGDGDGAAEGVDEAASGDDWPASLTFAVNPGEGEEGLEERYVALIRALERELGIEVDFFTATDYAGIVEALIAGNADMAHFGPFVYVIARQEGANIVPVGGYVGAPDDPPDAGSIGIRRAEDDDIQDVTDLVGRDVCFTDPGSSTGYLYPAAEFLDKDLDPEGDVNATYTGSHDAAILALLAGDCDAAFVFDRMARSTMPQEGSLDPDDIEVFWEDRVVLGPTVISEDLPDDLRAAIQEVLLEYNGDKLVEEGLCDDEFIIDDGPNGVPSCQITIANAWGMVALDDADFDSIREVCRLTEAPACQEL